MSETDQIPRPLPMISDTNRYFWESGKDGRLRILRCQDCGHYMHPYSAVCKKCRSYNVEPEAVSGRANLVSFTVNYQPWDPNVPVPYVVALVELEEQSNIRLVTNLPGCPIDEVEYGMAVTVCFEKYDDIYVPQFARAQEGGAS